MTQIDENYKQMEFKHPDLYVSARWDLDLSTFDHKI